MENQKLLHVDGKPFRCECGANVFTELETGRYSCNGCLTTYVSEKYAPKEYDSKETAFAFALAFAKKAQGDPVEALVRAGYYIAYARALLLLIQVSIPFGEDDSVVGRIKEGLLKLDKLMLEGDDK